MEFEFAEDSRTSEMFGWAGQFLPTRLKLRQSMPCSDLKQHPSLRPAPHAGLLAAATGSISTNANANECQRSVAKLGII